MSKPPVNSADYDTARRQKSEYDQQIRRHRKHFPKGMMTAEQKELIVCFLIDQRETARETLHKWIEMARTGTTQQIEGSIVYWKTAERILHGLIRCLEPKTK